MTVTVKVDPSGHDSNLEDSLISEDSDTVSTPGFSNPAISDSPRPSIAPHIKGDPHAAEARHTWADPLYRKRWQSIIMVYVVMFITVFQGSVYWSSMWPFLSSIDPTATEAFMGYIIMSFNLARVISAPLLGWLSNRLDQTKIPILIGMTFVIVGNVSILFVESLQQHRKWLLLAARATIGFGTGNAGPLFAYIIMASTVAERGTVITTRTAIASMGLILGPALQTLFVPIGFPGRAFGPLHLDMYTTPALSCAIVGTVMFIVFALFFEETWISVAESEVTNPSHRARVLSTASDKTGLDSSSSSVKPPADTGPKLPPFDRVAVIVTIFTKMLLMFCYTYDITLASPLTMIMFNWSAEQAVLYLGIIQMCGAVLCLIASCVTGRYILKHFRERNVIIAGVICFLLFFASSFSWPGLPPMTPVFPSNVTVASGASQVTSLLRVHSYNLQLSHGSLSTTAANHSHSSILNMHSLCTYQWCTSTTRIYVFQYVLGYFFMLMGYVLVQSGDGVLFSKLLGPRKQGTFSGIYQSGGKLGMSISPLVNTRLFMLYGPRVAWGFGSGLLLLNLVVLGTTYHRLLPLPAAHQYAPLA